MRGGLPAPRPSTPSSAPSSCVRFRPAHGRITPGSPPIQPPFWLFLLRSAVSCKRSASHTTVSPARKGAGPLALHPGRRAGSGGSSPGGRDGRPPDHQAQARTLDPGGNDQPDVRGAVVVFVAHLKIPAEVQHVHHDDDSGAGLLCLHPYPAGSPNRVAALAPLRRVHRSPDPTLFRPILRGTRRRGLRKSGFAWRHANVEPPKSGIPGRTASEIAWHNRPARRHHTFTRKGPRLSGPRSRGCETI